MIILKNLLQQAINNTVETEILAELTEVSPAMLHCSRVVSSTTISPSKGVSEGALLQLTADTHKQNNMF